MLKFVKMTFLTFDFPIVRIELVVHEIKMEAAGRRALFAKLRDPSCSQSFSFVEETGVSILFLTKTSANSAD